MVYNICLLRHEQKNTLTVFVLNALLGHVLTYLFQSSSTSVEDEQMELQRILSLVNVLAFPGSAPLSQETGFKESNNFSLGRPCGRLPSHFASTVLFGIFSFSILLTCPNQRNFCLSIFSNIDSVWRLCRIVWFLTRFLRAFPIMSLRNLISEAWILLHLLEESAQDSHSYVRVGT